MDPPPAPLLRRPRLHLPNHGLPTPLDRRHCRSHHRYPRRVVCLQAVLPREYWTRQRDEPSTNLSPFAARAHPQPLSHPQAYKPYSPRIPKDEEIPLHSFNGRPSVEGPHSSLLPPPPAGAYPPKADNGMYGHTAYPPAAHYAANGASGYGGELVCGTRLGLMKQQRPAERALSVTAVPWGTARRKRQSRGDQVTPGARKRPTSRDT